MEKESIDVEKFLEKLCDGSEYHKNIINDLFHFLDQAECGLQK